MTGADLLVRTVSPTGVALDRSYRRLGGLGGQSAGTVDGDLESCAHLTHPLGAEGAESIDEDSDRHAFDRIKIHG